MKEQNEKIKEKQKVKIKVEGERGITLIALVVTIVVLLILAGITINLLLGENGIIAHAQLAAEKTKEAEEKSNKELENLLNEMNEIIKGETPKEESVPEKANYSIKNNGKKTYYEKLSEAYEKAVDNGGENGGGTIVIEKDVTEVFEKSFEIIKTIKIDTNNKTLKIEATDDIQMPGDYKGLILVKNGTFTITGSGNIICEEEKWFMTAYGGNINIEGAVNINTAGHAVILQHGYTSNLTITGAKIEATNMRNTSFARNGKSNDYELKNLC